MKTAEAVRDGQGSRSLGDDDAHDREHTPYPAHEDHPANISGGVAGRAKQRIRADVERRAEDHQVHHADTAGSDHGHRRSRISSTRGWMPMTAPLTAVGEGLSSCM